MPPIIIGIVVLALVFFGLAIWKYFKPRVEIAEKLGRLEVIDEFHDLASRSQAKTRKANEGGDIDKKIQAVTKADETVEKIQKSLR